MNRNMEEKPGIPGFFHMSVCAGMLEILAQTLLRTVRCDNSDANQNSLARPVAASDATTALMTSPITKPIDAIATVVNGTCMTMD